jgi:hypothetical protein
MDFKIVGTINKVCVEDGEGKVVAEFNSLDEAASYVQNLKNQDAIRGFIVAREAPDLRTYDIPEKAVSSQEAADLITRFTIDNLGSENG